MYYKVSPIIVILFIVLIGILGFLGFKLVSTNKNGNSESGSSEVQNTDESMPTLELSTNTNEENQEFVIITANARIEDENGIYSITLPDGSTVHDEIATYTAKKNGNYTFKVKGNNGKIATLTFEVNNIREASAQNPYMPTGFSYIGGDIDSGYVIQDQYGNQYVWVPVESGKLTRNTMLDSNYEESNSSATALVNSVAQNYGFYIARFEAAKEEINGRSVAVSKIDHKPCTGITYLDAIAIASESASVFGYDGYKTSIMNSYAWDTVLKWIDKSVEDYSTNTSYGNYSGNIRNSGATESDVKNNICDLAGNVREWTTEIFKQSSASQKNITNEVISETVNYRVVRGGSANLSRTASSHSGYKENTSDINWGFRMILYK